MKHEEKIALIVMLSASLSCVAATFPGSGGDLASAADWNGAVPDDTEAVTIDKAGTYGLSANKTFERLFVTVNGCELAFGGNTLTTTVSSKSGVEVGLLNGGWTVFSGGTFDFSGTGHFHPAYNGKNMVTILTNGCVVTNVNTFYGARYAHNNQVKLAGGARAYVSELRLCNDSGYDNLLEISDGAQMHVSGRVYSDANGTIDAYGGNTLRVTGAGSLFRKYSSSYAMQLGFRQSGHTFHVTDGANVTFEGNGPLQLGGGGNIGATNNSLIVENAATATIPSIEFNTANNRVIVSNATLSCGTSLSLGKNGTCTGNLFQVIGPQVTLSLLGMDFYGNGACNIFSLEGGASWSVMRDSLFTNTHHSVFRVTGAGTVFGDVAGSNRFYMGDKNYKVTDACASNAVEVMDGAVFNAGRLCLMGIGNALVVSNGIVNVGAGDDSVALRVGYTLAANNSTNTTGCLLRICGETPQVNAISGGNVICQFVNNSVLRFEIPVNGYAKGHVPFRVTKKTLAFDGTCRLEIACEEFARKTGGTLTLIETGADISASVANCLRNSVNELPPDCALVVEKRAVKLVVPIRKGMTVSFK